MEKGDIYFMDLPDGTGSEQYGERPVLLLSRISFNGYVLVASLTSKRKKRLPVHVALLPNETGLHYRSLVMLEQLMPVAVENLTRRVGKVLNRKKMRVIEHSLKRSLGL